MAFASAVAAIAVAGAATSASSSRLGLKAGTGPCAGEYQLPGAGDAPICTHGPDPFSLASGETPAKAAGKRGPTVQCVGDGRSGKRVQLLYVRPKSVASDFATAAGQIRAMAAGMDQVYNDSAQQYGAVRHIRFLHNGSCVPKVSEVVVPNTAAENLNKYFRALDNKGYKKPSRKYVTFMDYDYICGIGETVIDDSPNQNNGNNGPSYVDGLTARIDTNCWDAEVAAHEFTHTLGAVQHSAPHATKFGHCWDDHDVMCYDDDGSANGNGTMALPNPPGGVHTLDNVCATVDPYESRLDCNGNDYFNPAAASGYLSTHWNTANSAWLTE